MRVTITAASWFGIGNGVTVDLDDVPFEHWDMSLEDAVRKAVKDFEGGTLCIVDAQGDRVTRRPIEQIDKGASSADVNKRVKLLKLAGYDWAVPRWLDMIGDDNG